MDENAQIDSPIKFYAAKIAETTASTSAGWLAQAAGGLASVASKSWRVIRWTHRIFTDDEVEFPEVEESPLKKLADREQEFHDFVRQQVICMWLFMALYLFAYWIISRLKRKTEREALYAGEEDYFVYRVSVWMCSISMAVSIGSLTLLPFSVIGVELLQLYEDNYYLQWLSYSLIGSLWNYVFTLSNISLFVLLPFSYFFIESQGFSSNCTRNGITQRIYETLSICALFIVVVLCLAEIVLTIIKYPVSFLSITSVNFPLIYSCVSLGGALLLLISTPFGFARMFSLSKELFYGKNEDDEKVNEEEEAESSKETLINEDNRKDSDSGIDSGSTDEMRLDTEDEMIFSTASNSDTLTSSKLRRRRKKHDYADMNENDQKNIEICDEEKEEDPAKNIGFDYSGKNSFYPSRRRSRRFSDDVHEDVLRIGLEERQRRYSKRIAERNSAGREQPKFNDYYVDPLHPSSKMMPFPCLSELAIGSPLFASTPLGLFNIEPSTHRFSDRRCRSETDLWTKSEITKEIGDGMFRHAAEKVRAALKVGKNSRRGRLIRLLLGLRFPTTVAVLLILTTISLMMVAINALKLLFGFRSLPEYAQYIELHTRHSFGLFGACIETLIIIYVMLTSFVGLYSLPLLRSLKPIKKDTSMTAIIINCSLILVASSALPVIVNTLGMTTFDLLGAYSSLQWLSSFRVVLAYNLVFLLASLALLFNQLTASMRNEILRRISQLRSRLHKFRSKRQSCGTIPLNPQKSPDISKKEV